MIAAPIGGALGIPIQKLKGVTGVLARENAIRNPKRTLGHRRRADDRRGAGRAHHGVRGVGPHVGQRGHRPVDEGRLRDHVARASARVPSRSRRQRTLAELPEVTSASGDPQRPGADRRLGHARSSPPTPRDRLAVRPRAEAGHDQRAQRHRHRRARQHRQRQRRGSWADGPDHVRADRHAAVHGRVDLHAVGLHELRDHDRRLRAELHRPVRLPGVREHRRRRHPGRHRRDQEGDAPYPEPKVETATSTRPRQAAQINQFLNLVYVLLFFAIIIALFGIANTLGLSIIERRHELGLLRAVGHDPPPAALERAAGSR